MEPINRMLANAGRLSTEHEGAEVALRALVTARAAQARHHRRRRVVLPSLAAGGAMVLLGAGAAAATQWGPWTYVTDPDIVIAHEWTDVDGNALGACESRLAADTLSPLAGDAARRHLAGLDLGSLAPDPEVIAGLLVAVDRPERMSHLVPGANTSDFDINHTGPIWDDAVWSDARILQHGLTHTVFAGMADELGAIWPELEAKVETQCATDPAGVGQQ